tara:strand:+ start:126 stop:419 length:294 start_codon:yes stop_codon:yes gene_type:complete
MTTVILLLIICLIIWKYLVDYIKFIRTGDPNENNENYWKFSYDFKPTKKTDFSPDNPEFLRKKRFRNRLVFLLYIDVLIIFLLANNLASHILEMIVN